MTHIPPAGYSDFLREAKAQIRKQQLQALRAANKELLAQYGWLGEAISLRQAQLGRGKAVVETLARDLQAEFPGSSGFSAQNLWLMRQLFNEYSEKPKLQPLVGARTCSSWPAARTIWSASFTCMPRPASARRRTCCNTNWTTKIGIVICRSKTRTIVEYVLRNMQSPLGIATYSVTPQLPASFEGDLPSPQDIAARLQAWDTSEGE